MLGGMRKTQKKPCEVCYSVAFRVTPYAPWLLFPVLYSVASDARAEVRYGRIIMADPCFNRRNPSSTP
jgi:hypothetical protein